MPLTALRARARAALALDVDPDAVRSLLEQHRAARLDQIRAYTLAGLGGGPGLDPDARRAALAAARVALEEIDLALTRLAAGTYGTCTRCSGRVDPVRLLTRPYARFCARCDDGT